MSHRFGPVYAAQDYAGFWRRTAALILDAVILGAVYYLVAYAYYFFAPVEYVTHHGYRYIIAGWWVLCVVYSIALRFSMRGTLGYRIVGIQYAYMLSEKPPWTRLALRSLLAVVLLWFLALDHIWILVDRRKQAWHDKMSGFYVVRRRAEPLATVQMVQRAINVMTYTFVVWEPIADAPHAPDEPNSRSRETRPTHGTSDVA